MKNLSEYSSMKPLNELLVELQNTNAIAAVSEKIDRALHSYQPGSTTNVSYDEFKDTIAGFVKHVYQYGLQIPRTMTLTSALSEGFDLLDRYYVSGSTHGLDAAFLDATDRNGDGPETVLRQLSQVIKEREVRQYLNYRYLLAIDPTDLETHLQIVEGLVAERGLLLPDDFKTDNPCRFAKYYRDLLELVIDSDSLFAQIWNSSRTFSGA